MYPRKCVSYPETSLVTHGKQYSPQCSLTIDICKLRKELPGSRRLRPFQGQDKPHRMNHLADVLLYRETCTIVMQRCESRFRYPFSAFPDENLLAFRATAEQSESNSLINDNNVSLS